MLAMDVIEPTHTEWGLPIVFVPKKYEKLRFWVDYLELNAVTIRDPYPILHIEDCTNCLVDATIFSTLDTNSGYW